MTHTIVAVVAQDGGRMEINCQLSLGISLDRLLGRREKKQLEWETETERERGVESGRKRTRILRLDQQWVKNEIYGRQKLFLFFFRFVFFLEGWPRKGTTVYYMYIISICNELGIRQHQPFMECHSNRQHTQEEKQKSEWKTWHT